MSKIAIKNKIHTGKNNGMFNKSLMGSLNGMFGKQHTLRTKEKRRQIRLGKKVPANAGKNCYLYGKTPKHTKRVQYKRTKMRSSWECLYAAYLDNKKIKNTINKIKGGVYAKSLSNSFSNG